MTLLNPCGHPDITQCCRLKEVAHFHNNFSPSCAKGAGVRACNDTQAALARRMGKGDSGALLLPLSVTGTAVVLTLLVFWWWSKRSVGRGSRGTRFTHEDGQPVRRSTRCGAASRLSHPPGCWPAVCVGCHTSSMAVKSGRHCTADVQRCIRRIFWVVCCTGRLCGKFCVLFFPQEPDKRHQMVAR